MTKADSPTREELLTRIAQLERKVDLFGSIVSHAQEYIFIFDRDLHLKYLNPAATQLAQEMFREINTSGSKANESRIARQVIAFKSELEAVREQAQNIE